jgi:hypothetical protein
MLPNWFEICMYTDFRHKYFTGEDLYSSIGTVYAPGRFARTIDKIAEFGSFIWSIVLVRKWRICPIVEMPEVS